MVRDVYGKVGTPINMGDQMFLTVLNVVTSMLWGGTLHGEDRSRIGMEFRRVIVEMVGLMGKPNISDLFPALAWFDLQGIESRAKSLGKNKSKESKDFLQFMLELMHQGDDKTSVSITQLKALFMDIVVGATDTSSTTVEWAMAELLQHPQTMQKPKKNWKK
ncbi:Flavonoid 3'-monooxygenase [Vitis vinifera]|uniref:Flavonoid 3'-monooxygenase n=1 Tax=Vitis vinifera TaxID=29760 RepID=A0A438DIT4_VITVI|nr:Flavonoid 3'-monooxygenase [Vitis vinifera]